MARRVGPGPPPLLRPPRSSRRSAASRLLRPARAAARAREHPAAAILTLAALSARLASVGDNHLGGWISYRASKSALNQVLRCGSIELGRRWPHAVVVGLHPGTVETELSMHYARGRYTASPAEAEAAPLSSREHDENDVSQRSRRPTGPDPLLPIPELFFRRKHL